MKKRIVALSLLALLLALLLARWGPATDPWSIVSEHTLSPSYLEDQVVFDVCTVQRMESIGAHEANTVFHLVWMAEHLIFVPIGDGQGHTPLAIAKGPITDPQNHVLTGREVLLLPYYGIPHMDLELVFGRPGVVINGGEGPVKLRLLDGTTGERVLANARKRLGVF